MIFLLLGLHGAAAPQADAFPLLTQACTDIRTATAQVTAANLRLDQTIRELDDQCTTATDLMDLGKRIHEFDKLRAKNVLSRITDFVDEGGFKNIRYLYDPLIEMGFEDIAKEISEINQRGTGRR